MERQNATGIAAGVILVVLGGVTALILSAGPSIASALAGDNTPAHVEVDQQPVTEPSVYVVDENGNLIAANEQIPAEADNAGQEAGTYGEEHEELGGDHAEADYENDEEEEEGDYEDDDHDEVGDEEDDENDEDDDYKDDDHEAYGAPTNG